MAQRAVWRIVRVADHLSRDGLTLPSMPFGAILRGKRVGDIDFDAGRWPYNR